MSAARLFMSAPPSSNRTIACAQCKSLAISTRVTTAPREERAVVNRQSAQRGRPGDSDEAADAPREINVIGKRVEEANELVDKFIDDAALAGKPSVRIIHGYGTGALRRGIAEFLSAHPLVEKIRHEEENRGGQAVTIAELVR